MDLLDISGGYFTRSRNIIAFSEGESVVLVSFLVVSVQFFLVRHVVEGQTGVGGTEENCWRMLADGLGEQAGWRLVQEVKRLEQCVF